MPSIAILDLAGAPADDGTFLIDQAEASGGFTISGVTFETVEGDEVVVTLVTDTTTLTFSTNVLADGSWSIVVPSGFTDEVQFVVTATVTDDLGVTGDISALANVDLFPNGVAPFVTINPIDGDNIIGAVEAAANSIPISGTTNATVGTVVTVDIAGQGSYFVLVEAGVNGGPNTWSATIDTQTEISLIPGYYTVTVSLFDGAAASADTTFLVTTISDVTPTAAFTEGNGPGDIDPGTAIRLSGDVTIVDPVLDGLGDYNSMVLTVSASATTVDPIIFGIDLDSLAESGVATFDLDAVTGELFADGVSVGFFSGLGGTSLSIAFSSASAISQAIVNAVARAVTYVNASDAPAPETVINFDTSDGFAPFGSVSITVTNTAVNDAPILTGDFATTVAENGTVVLTPEDFGLVDPDTPLDGVTFSVVAASGGTVLRSGAAAASFTLADLIGGLVTFKQDGSEVVRASFDVTVEDGNQDGSEPTPYRVIVGVTPVDDAPTAAFVVDADLPVIGGTYSIAEHTVRRVGVLTLTDGDGGPVPEITVTTGFDLRTTADPLVFEVWVSDQAVFDFERMLAKPLGPQTVPLVISMQGALNNLASLELAPADVGPDSALGTNRADELHGGITDDNLSGGAGNDTLNGGAGVDALDGGAGDDTASFAGSATGVFVDLVGQTSWDGTSTDVLTSIENVIGSGLGDNLIGDDSDNTFEGLDGVDTINGGGNGAFGDTVSYRLATQGVSVELAPQNSWDGTSMDFLAGIENATGSQFRDVLIGDANGNVLEGLDGVDFLYGFGGSDTVMYRSASQGVEVDLTAQYSWDGTSMDFFVSIENVIGSAHADFIFGDASDNLIEGLGGVDTISGGGNGSAGDTFSYRSATAGTQIDLTSQTAFDGTSMTFLSSIENGVGSSFGDILNGSSGVNRFEGLAGNDTIVGAGGDDVFVYRTTGTGADLIADFDADATGGQDLIDLSGRGFSASSIGTSILISVSGLPGPHTRISIGDDSILLFNVSMDAVTAEDFIF